MALTEDVGFGALPLCIKRIELLIQAMFGGFASVDGAALSMRTSPAVFPSTLLFRTATLFPLFADRVRQAEEGHPVPAGTCHLCRDRAQGGKESVLIPEALSSELRPEWFVLSTRA